jgi:hypothetical protein
MQKNGSQKSHVQVPLKQKMKENNCNMRFSAALFGPTLSFGHYFALFIDSLEMSGFELSDLPQEQMNLATLL